ncbi:hypothetical protein TWF694_011662 [Orbilia ellipsospora]|uniref:DUF7143 domain-containing protein n=1 Tax=Orbilia ellipsospora TaxID=2528407 RepID=A0AAV9X728_9PEZI
MYFQPSFVLLTSILPLLATSLPIINLAPRAALCSIIGKTALPAETQEAADAIASVVTCNTALRPLQGIPDTISGGIKFSSINFAASKLTPLDFALQTFSTPTPPRSASLTTFQNQLNVYVAQEAGIRSINGNLAIKAPKFFLEFQIARIKTSQGQTITDPGQTVEHLLGKVIKNAGRVSQATIDAVNKLATQL